MAALCAPPFPLVPQIFYSLFGEYTVKKIYSIIVPKMS